MKVTVEEAAAILKRGGIVAVPTETVYGLAADAANQAAVLRIFEAKHRPPDNPLICHLPTAAAIERFAAAPPSWVEQFWPGPLTVLLPHKNNLAPAVTAGSRFCAFRIPNHPVMLALLRLAETPLSAPSANTSGRVSPVNAAMVENDLGDTIDGILDGGPCAVGLESTIVQP
ncbi:MAG TPA: L-threonylcarbamoyladenylate synthase, partial [Leptospiraceae bacterium]|nr:L-threonylcarbamoyladenylate synthase [Leptospiraceae bacterium]